MEFLEPHQKLIKDLRWLITKAREGKYHTCIALLEMLRPDLEQLIKDNYYGSQTKQNEQ